MFTDLKKFTDEFSNISVLMWLLTGALVYSRQERVENGDFIALNISDLSDLLRLRRR